MSIDSLSQSKRIRKYCICPVCKHRGQRKKDLCSLCREPGRPRAKEIKICPGCNHQGKRFFDICFNCQIKRKGTAKGCPVCSHSGYRKTEMCCKCLKQAGLKQPKPPSLLWTQERIDFLIANYPENGAAWVAQNLGIRDTCVKNKARRLGLNLTKDATKRIVHDAAAKHMRLHNPAKTPEGRERSRKQGKDPRMLAKLLEAQAKICKEKPTKLEFRLCQILDSFGIEYEHQCVVKPKFIVDVKIGGLIIEADGDWWHGHPRFEPLRERQIKQKIRDSARDKYLTACGYKVERIWESDLTAELVKSILEKYSLI